MQLNRANLLRLQSRSGLGEGEESEPSSDEQWDVPDFVDDYDEESELIDKMSNRDSLASQKGQMSNIFQNSLGKRHRSLSFAYCLHAMTLTP